MAIQKFIVSRDENMYHAWPDLLKTKSDKLICTFTECDHHLCRDNSRVVVVTSTDRGRSWSEKKPVSEVSDASFFFDNARLSALSDGRIAIICSRHHPAGKGDPVQYVWFSEDEGESWSEPIILPFPIGEPDGFRELSSGRYIVLGQINGFRKNAKEQLEGLNNDITSLTIHLWYSDDKGKSWSDMVTVANDPRYLLCEPSMIECPDGTLVVFMRENSFTAKDVYKCISRDGGLTWSEVYGTPISSGHRPTARWLNDGRAIVTYRYVTTYTPNPGSVSLGLHNTFLTLLKGDELARVEREGTYYRTMPIDYDRSEKPDSGYTGSVQFDDGEIYIVNYIKDDAEKAQIRGYSLYPTDIIL